MTRLNDTDELLKDIEEYFHHVHLIERRKNIRREVVTAIELDVKYLLENAPTIDSVKHGRWISDGHHIRCDQCGMYMCDTDREGDRIPTEFCPHCGSKMGDEDEK